MRSARTGHLGDAYSRRSTEKPQSSGMGRGELRCVRAAAGLDSSRVREPRRSAPGGKRGDCSGLLAQVLYIAP